MERAVLLTGSSGFVGKAIMRRAEELEDLTIIPVVRECVASQVNAARLNFDDMQISILNLAWPKLHAYSSSSPHTGDAGDDPEWLAFRSYVSGLVESCKQNGMRFFQVGSGIEPYAACDPPGVDDPYLSYGRRKAEVWKFISEQLPENSWRLRLHFLFGQGESSRRFIPSAIKAGREMKPITVGAPSRRRCWMSVDDAAAGLLTATKQVDPDNWDICGDVPISFTELLGCVEEVVGAAVRIDAPVTAIADGECPIVNPENPAPFMGPGIGNKENLQDRLHEYASMMTSRES